jgi:CubicO group peptidase (beta-lactamase class C family)
MRKAAAFVAAILGLAFLSGAIAQTTQPTLLPSPKVRTEALQTPPVTAEQLGGVHPLTAQDVDSWLDGFVPYAIGKGDIPGAVVVIVKDGQILASRGYGYADVAKHKKVDPATTLFRPGSVSKLFTWTAVMQQVEQGKLKLDADVNQYLDFKIPPYKGQPITLNNIMTHTAGFEEHAKGVITTEEKANRPFDVLLKRSIPKRVYAPGSTPAYSNYATALAAYMVQRVSGQPFDAYIERNIFVPLGMQHATFRQPLPANLKPLMAEGYVSGEDKPYGYEFVGPAPAGSVAATGEDMGRFMIAHLQNGEYNGKRILQPQTAQLMHSALNIPIAGLNGMAHGFYQTNINGLPVIAHGGDTIAFHSDLHLFLNKGVGLFVSMNSAGKEGAAGGLRTELFEEFADRYFPGPPDNRSLPKDQAKPYAEKLVGAYASSRRSHGTFLSLTDLIGQAKVSLDKDGRPIVTGFDSLGGQPQKWIPVAPNLWRAAQGHDMLGARVDGDKVRISSNELAPIIVWDKVPWYRSSSVLMPLVYASLAVLIVTVLLWPTRALVRRKFASKLPLEGRQLWTYRGSRIAALLMVLVLAGWALVVSAMFSDFNKLNGSLDPIITILELLSIIAFVGGFAVMAWYVYTAWKSGWRWTGKGWSIALLLASAVLLYIALTYRLLTLSTNY